MKLFCAVFILVIAFALVFVIKESEPIPQNFNVSQHEITSPGPLLTSQGQLIEIGWARFPLKQFNLEDLQVPLMNRLFTQKFMRKKWDFISIMTQRFILLFAIADLGYLGNTFIHIFDLETQQKYLIDKDILPFSIPELPSNSCNLSLTKELKYETTDYLLSFSDTQSDKFNKRTIEFSGLTSNSHKIKGSFELTKPNSLHEDIVMLTPLSEDLKSFYYNMKSYNLPVSGELVIDETKVSFSKDIANAGLDYGRGIWTYNTFWIWASANGFLKDGRRFGLNLGGGFQNYNRSNASEDSVFIDGKIIKLNVVSYEIDEQETDMSKNWIFQTKEKQGRGSCYFEFERKINNLKKTDFYVLKSHLKQFFGGFRGWVIIDDKNNKVEIEGLSGVAEVHRARW